VPSYWMPHWGKIMAVSAIKHLERMRGSKVTREEYHRLTMMQQALNLQDDDAVWMLFLAMEYQKYTTNNCRKRLQTRLRNC